MLYMFLETRDKLWYKIGFLGCDFPTISFLVGYGLGFTEKSIASVKSFIHFV